MAYLYCSFLLGMRAYPAARHISAEGFNFSLSTLPQGGAPLGGAGLDVAPRGSRAGHFQVAPPALGERLHRVLARRLAAVRRAAYGAVMAARPHPGAIVRWTGKMRPTTTPASSTWQPSNIRQSLAKRWSKLRPPSGQVSGRAISVGFTRASGTSRRRNKQAACVNISVSSEERGPRRAEIERASGMQAKTIAS